LPHQAAHIEQTSCHREQFLSGARNKLKIQYCTLSAGMEEVPGGHPGCARASKKTEQGDIRCCEAQRGLMYPGISAARPDINRVVDFRFQQRQTPDQGRRMRAKVRPEL
jgi:hypothetical protein